MAVSHGGEEGRQALSDLCSAYWYPLYAYFRRCGRGAYDAEDLTQGLFVRLLERGSLAAADPARGRLRTFLLACAQNHLADDWDRARAGKRAATVVSFDAIGAEERYLVEPTEALTPDRLFQRRWALTVLEQSLQFLAAEYEAAGQTALYAALRPFLGFGPDPEKRYEEISRSLDMPVGTLKNKVFRLRERWRKILFEQVAATLDKPSEEEIKAELSELLGCV